jgi:FO synthase
LTGITRDEAYRLVQTPLDALDGLLEAAGGLRDRLKGHHLTYSRKVFLPVTNLCRDRCSYCTFRKSPNQAGAKTMSLEEIRTWSARARQLDCKEALMCLGDRPEAVFPSYQAYLRRMGVDTTIEYVAQACRIALEEGLWPHTNAGVMTRSEMEALRPTNISMGLMLENVSPRLRSKGMPHAAAPDKDPALRVRMLEEAGELKIPFTTGLLMGIGETPEECIDTLAEIDRIHRAHGHIQEVIVQPFRVKPDVPMAGHGEPSELELARMVAVSRLYLVDMNLQAPPNLAPGGIDLLIRAGINDWGGISPYTKDFINPEAPWPHLDQLARSCQALGYSLGERLAIYPEYLDRKWIDESLYAGVLAAHERIACTSICHSR